MACDDRSTQAGTGKILVALVQNRIHAALFDRAHHPAAGGVVRIRNPRIAPE